MGLIYWGSLAIYISGLGMATAVMGINWNKLETHYKRSPRSILVLVYLLNFAVLFFGFRIPYIIHFFINVLMVLGIFLFSKFQIIGLTGGIATGKSTVSTILADNGFDIIDADKISREVSFLNHTHFVLILIF